MDVVMKYKEHIRRKTLFGFVLLLILLLFSIYSLCVGTYTLSIDRVFNALIGNGDKHSNLVIWNVRLPRIIAAIVVGTSLSVAGAVMQCILRNPLASPYTIGLSQGAMFGAAFAITMLGFGGTESYGRIVVENPYVVTIFAFLGALTGVFVILLLARLKGFTPEAMILAGVAIGALFTAGTMLIQYFASELQLAAIVYWTFGDLGRPLWRDNIVMTCVTIPTFLYFIYKRWDYNALESGEETAKSLGVNTEKVRLIGMLVSSFAVSVCVALVGIIGFVGLVCPHITRILIGGDYRHLISISALVGAILLLISDTFARIVLSPIILPVGIITSFMGAPMFIYLLIRLHKR
ncbi:MAG: iron ABC transporter permease [Thermoproteota archaeon]|nr:MAG: iron ABC transporter permease [Candidatus Korarchaeota archaeon]